MKTILLFLFFALSNIAFAQDETTLTFTVQPKNMCLQRDEACTLTCTAECGSSTVQYYWYATDKKGATKKPISSDWTTNPELAIEPFSEKGIRYYVCGATVDQINIEYSDVVAAAYSGLPILVIETVNHEEPTAEPVWNADHTRIFTIINETKVPSSMQIYKDGQSIYDSGVYEEKKSGLTIKLRGNSSAVSEKKPYKIKLQKKRDLLALINGSEELRKDKEWVLLKGGTDLMTFIGTTVAEYAGQPWTPQSTFVNVVMNGEYRGIYLLIEAVNKSEMRVNVSDDGYLIEREGYAAYEEVKFETERGLWFSFKFPDDKDISKDETLLSYIKDYMNIVENKIQKGEYEDYIDVESFARWNVIHDILGTWDGSGSNQFMSKYDKSTPENPNEDGTWSKLTMSTLWDFDSILEMTDSWAKNHAIKYNYSDWLFANINSAFFDSYQAQYDNISAGVWPYLSAKLIELKNSLGEGINIARQLDANKWHASYTSIETNIQQAEAWFPARGVWLDNKINHLLAPDFTTLVLQTEKTYDATNIVNYSGSVGIANSSYINDGDEVTIKITSIKYNGKTTDASKIIVQFELDGKDKDKYELTYTKYEFPAKIIPQNEYYGALTISIDQNGKHAVLDGNSTSELSEIKSQIAVKDVVFERQFSVGKPSTIVLPFSTSNYSGGKFYTFTGVLYDEDKSKWYADLTEETSEIVAHKPYIFIPSAESLTFPDGVTIEKSPEKEMITPGENTNWTFKGVYAYNVFETVTGKEYGFAGKEAKDGDIDIAIGDFVHIGAGAKIKPFRCYLTFNGVSLSKSAIELPSSIEVRILEPVATVVSEETPVVISEEGTSTDAFNEDILTPISEVSRNNGTKVWSYGKTIFIEAQPNTDYQIFDINGRILKTAVTSSDHDEVSLSYTVGGVAIVRIANKSYKVKY